MFTEMVATLAEGRVPDLSVLRRRFDMAVTKKTGIVRLPPAFWMDDPKINPRTDHLFWAALLLRDRQRVEIVLSIMAAEIAEKKPSTLSSLDDLMRARVRELTGVLLDFSPNPACRRLAARTMRRLLPEWLPRENNHG